MGLHDILEYPAVYELKTAVLSLGRRSVCKYLGTLALRPGSRVLDVACGTGRHADLFPGSVWGIDENARYIAYARKHYRGRFLVMDARHLGFGDGQFDLVFCVGLCHHLPDTSVRAVVSEMKRVARPGGRVLIIEGVRPRGGNVVGRFLFAMDRGRNTRTLHDLAALLAPEEFAVRTENIPGSFPYCRAVLAWAKPG
jgi:ubiquinone/menaquinone biosynthesis C-methylase UbiE